MKGPPAACPICKAPADSPCVGSDGHPVAGIHTERVLAAVKEMFGTFAPPVPRPNGKGGSA